MSQFQKVNLLIVDDRPENLLALEAVLCCDRYNLMCANSGEEALKYVLQDEFAVILMDVQMPGLSGFETAKLIRAREKSKHIPIIFITAISQTKANELDGYSAGAIDYIFKPFHPEILKSKIENLVKLHEHQEQIRIQNKMLAQSKQELEQAYERLNSITSKLQKTEALARVIGETSLDGIITCNEKGQIVNVNPSANDMFGCSTDDLLGNHISSLIPGIDGAGLLPADELIQKEKGKLWESKACRTDGTFFPAEIQIGEMKLDHQNIYVFSIRDITERKLMEEERKQQYLRLERLVDERTMELTKSKNQIETILKSITDCFFAVDHDWNLTFVNPEAENIMGKPKEQLIGQNFWDLFPRSSEMMRQLFDQAVNTQAPVHFEEYSELSETWNEIHAYPSAHGLSVYFSDITARKQMEFDLRFSQERFHKIFQSSPSLISIQSLKDGRYIDVNESWLQHTGYEYDEIIGQAEDFLQIRSHSDKDKEESRQVDLLDSLRNVKICYQTKLGEVRSGLLSTELIEIQNQKYILCVVTDITNRELLEKEMARLDRLHLIGEMAAGIAHEIRNPMTTVRGFLQMSKFNPHSEYIDLMLEELDRANAIITEFLTLAKNKTTDRKPQSLNDIIKALHPLIQAEAMLADKYVNIVLSRCPDLLLDEKEIRQLILNLALNGLEAMDAGGVLTIETTVRDDKVVLVIRDQGCGIKEEHLEKIWTPFFTTKEKGTGLGLAVCYSVVARHQAVIDVKSNGTGTTFSIHFNPNTGALMEANNM